jgi:alpha-beta hydrolase superfamily lysophospholipase
MPKRPELTLTLRGVERGPVEGGAARLTLRTDAGDIAGRWYEAAPGNAAVLWVFGAGGGLNGPAGGLYPRLAKPLAAEGVASLELAYRRPAELAPCILDVLLGVEYLAAAGRSRVVLVGHSFGGAVVIAAGAASPAVVAVAALSSQTYGAGAVGDLSPRPLLLLHGGDDDILPSDCSRKLYRDAREPKQLILYPGCRHGLDDCRDAVDRDLLAWLRGVTSSAPAAGVGAPAR